MKNLKKILLGLLVLVLLVSSTVVLVVTAEEKAVQYTGTLEKAQQLFSEVPGYDDPLGEDGIRMAKLAAAYSYIITVDPETEGYTELKADIDEIALVLSNRLHKLLLDRIDKGDTLENRKLALSDLRYVLTEFKVTDEEYAPAGDNISFKALKESARSVNGDIMKALYESAAKSASAAKPDYIKSMSELASLYEYVDAFFPLLSEDERDDTFKAFYGDYNRLSVTVAESVVAYLDGLKTAGADNYYSELERLVPTLKDHINKNCPVDYDAFEPSDAEDLEARSAAIDKALESFAIGQIRSYLEDYKALKNEDLNAEHPELDRASRFAKVSRALSQATISSDSADYNDYLALSEEIEKEALKVAEIKEQRRRELEMATPLYMYEQNANLYNYTFTSQAETMLNPNYDRDEYSERVVGADGNAYWRYVILGEPNKHSTGNATYQNSSYVSMTQTNITNGFVMSFDFMAEGINGEHYEQASFSNEWTDAKGIRLQNYGSSVFTIAYDAETDSLKVYNRAGGTVAEQTTVTNIAAEGQWFNVMFIYDPDTHTCKFYIDYEYIFDIYMAGWVDGAVRTIFRGGHGNGSAATWNYTSYDNVTFYEGKQYRDVNRFNIDGKTDEEKAELFIFSAEQAMSGSEDFRSTDFAYRSAASLLADMEAYAQTLSGEAFEKLSGAINAFKDYDYDNIFVGIKAQNLKEILSMVDALEAIPVTTQDLARINSAVTAIETFIEENSDYIDKADKNYNEAMKRVDAVKVSLSRLDDVRSLVKVLTQFTRATSLASMTKRYNSAMEIYESAKYGNYNYRKLVENDPLFISFEALINGTAQKGDPEYITWNDYYISIPAKLAVQQRLENSGKIITCIEIILDMEGYENTDEYWALHSDKIDVYITIIRNIIVSGNYDASYQGLDEAILQYELIDEYFNKLLQEEHIAVIGAQLDNFVESEYIEKVGICTFLDRYFENNPDIDLSNPVMQEYKYRLELYKAELESQEKDYVARLEENTKQFISTVSLMASYTTYAELKPIYDTALSYYYLMNVDSEDAKAAISLFESYGDALKTIEVNSALFIAESTNLNIIDRLGPTVEYSVLSDLSKYYPYLDATYSEEIQSLMLRYDSLAEKYNSAASSANNAADTASAISSSLRSNQISVTILAGVNQLYKNTGR